MQEWPGSALNMSAIRDSCQPSATNQRLNGLKSMSVGWHESRCPMPLALTSVPTAQHRPLNEFSLQFQFCPVLAHFRYETKRQCQATENRTALY